MQAIKSSAIIGSGGHLELRDLPLAAGTTVEIIVLANDSEDTSAEFVRASETSIGFWDNPVDDRVWNDA